jgi:hypothetical protein
MSLPIVISAKAGIQARSAQGVTTDWIPAFAGMTGGISWA